MEYGKGGGMPLSWLNYLAWQRWEGFTDLMKVPNKLTLSNSNGDYPGWTCPSQVCCLEQCLKVKRLSLSCWTWWNKPPWISQLQGNEIWQEPEEYGSKSLQLSLLWAATQPISWLQLFEMLSRGSGSSVPWFLTRGTCDTINVSCFQPLNLC